MYLLCSPLPEGNVQKDFTKFANQRFLKTANWQVLGRLLSKHAAGLKDLDLELLASNPAEGRRRISEFLLGPRDNYPETLVHDLHRIVRLDSAQGMQLILDEAARQRVVLLDPEAPATATSRDIALLAFVDHPDVFTEAEHTSVFIAPPSRTCSGSGGTSKAPMNSLARRSERAEAPSRQCGPLVTDR